MSPFSRTLLLSPELGVEPDGSYRPGGVQQFSRCVARALSTSRAVRELEVWGLLDSDSAVRAGMGRYLGGTRRADARLGLRGFNGDRNRMAIEFALRQHAFDHVMFLHVGVGRLGATMIRPGRCSLWLVGIEVRRALRTYEKLVVRRARPLLSISRFSSDEMRRFNPGLPTGDVVHLCVEPDAPWMPAPPSPAKYVASERERAVLIVARMASDERYKGHDQLIDAWPAVIARAADAELWITGSGDDADRLRAKAAALPAPARERVHFLGRVSHEELLARYERARVFAMPSTGEGFGLVFVEAMRYGLPCICSHDSAAEIVLDGETGLIVDQSAPPIADACASLLTDDALADRLGSAGRARFAAEYTFDRFRDRLLDTLALAR